MKILFFFLFIFSAQASTLTIDEQWNLPDWSENASIDSNSDRANLYQLNPEEFRVANRNGRLHSLWYNVAITGLKVPYRPIEAFTSPEGSIFKSIILKITNKILNFSSPDDLYREMGLKKYPDTESMEESGVYYVPFLNNKKPDVRMGITIQNTEKGRYVTASCTACHAESLFGRPIIGLTNKTPRANTAFDFASKLVPKVSSGIIKATTKASQGEVEMWKEMQHTFHWIGVKEPQTLGLDTSLATVSLSLSKRAFDPFATITREAYKKPRKNPLEDFVSDSKPLPWFTLKYKTRWLSDGSVISGNPILTNFLWNEIGRGVDLHKLSAWLDLENTKKEIIELTAAVFATTPPRYTDFFPASSINLESAKRGEILFNQSCQHCHGSYEKNWETGLETTLVNYPKKTLVKDVGTDPNRYQAMELLAPDLNRLEVSKKMGIKVVPQKGYVPPPLVGIWARWPYFHNNSAPTLCDVISKPEERRKKWYVGQPVNPVTDFDNECNGFPKIENAPKEWRDKNRLFDTKKAGLTNTGHFKIDYSDSEKKDLISFLKTL